MAKRKSLQNDDCPVARAVDLVGDRWSMLIIRDAMDGIRRFGDFQRNLGVARNILSDRLSALVDAGLLAIQPASDGSAYQEYVLTAKGESLFPAIVALRQWGERHLFAPGEAHSTLVEKASGKRVSAMHPHDHDGKVLKAMQTVVKKLAPK
ncbi:winged helix-turn-helix transcriptional regulator [Duganella sp. P38]|uniref:winged helix-turn-helix transcriptional regulator n=1 Tax=Duganella sp. P38 TaxID=3423949 RepID=UPI003D7AE839